MTTDRISAFDVIMPNPVPGKGIILNRMSAFWFEQMKDIIGNHIVSTNPAEFPEECAPYRKDLEGRSMLVKKAAPLPVECIVRGYEVTYNDKGVIIWSGGPDLVVPLFSPPLLITKGGRKFYMSEETQNIGTVTATASVTRYYISAVPIVDVTTAISIGERSIPALQPGKSNSINQRTFRMPGNLPAGTYYLAACTDANNTVVELNENNNCSFSQIEGHQSFIIPATRIKDANANANDNDEDDDKCEDKDHHDDQDCSKSKDGLMSGKPFGSQK